MHRFVLVFFDVSIAAPTFTAIYLTIVKWHPVLFWFFFVIYLKYNRLFIVDTGRRQVFSSDLSKTPVK